MIAKIALKKVICQTMFGGETIYGQMCYLLSTERTIYWCSQLNKKKTGFKAGYLCRPRAIFKLCHCTYTDLRHLPRAGGLITKRNLFFSLYDIT
jgi:hypothetical protein